VSGTVDDTKFDHAASVDVRERSPARGVVATGDGVDGDENKLLTLASFTGA
jgi:hypothetical protein